MEGVLTSHLVSQEARQERIKQGPIVHSCGSQGLLREPTFRGSAVPSDSAVLGMRL